ncbi:uncharacterized protein K452DRAFT_150386 [Aplosporella prunicola CBS 121167]|uniref:Uncharacterized protein n=1 Tax=Aplosporella prunicola CBS 121167 TaxID=1176127 RepID=A0A6A6AVH9_9PEZI|nr:uncharacterized protein K452DRAFT_150386 [Aplosporella prunicola CBS 121167]KAF2135949.1 hypothetical protein K452DRAFT_150386 [Aplosporella prunicola CBS 121167]
MPCDGGGEPMACVPMAFIWRWRLKLRNPSPTHCESSVLKHIRPRSNFHSLLSAYKRSEVGGAGRSAKVVVASATWTKRYSSRPTSTGQKSIQVIIKYDRGICRK